MGLSFTTLRRLAALDSGADEGGTPVEQPVQPGAAYVAPTQQAATSTPYVQGVIAPQEQTDAQRKQFLMLQQRQQQFLRGANVTVGAPPILR